MLLKTISTLFALLSDDGSTLTIDSEQIVDNDGPHGPKEIVGQKALAKRIIIQWNYVISTKTEDN